MSMNIKISYDFKNLITMNKLVVKTTIIYSLNEKQILMQATEKFWRLNWKFNIINTNIIIYNEACSDLKIDFDNFWIDLILLQL